MPVSGSHREAKVPGLIGNGAVVSDSLIQKDYHFLFQFFVEVTPVARNTVLPARREQLFIPKEKQNHI